MLVMILLKNQTARYIAEPNKAQKRLATKLLVETICQALLKLLPATNSFKLPLPVVKKLQIELTLRPTKNRKVKARYKTNWGTSGVRNFTGLRPTVVVL